MIQITPHMKILLSVKPVDFRKGLNGLMAICRNELKEDPLSGIVFIFINRSRKSIKIIMYDGQGAWLCMKRLSNGRFKWWPEFSSDRKDLLAHELQTLIWNGDINRTGATQLWRPIKKS